MLRSFFFPDVQCFAPPIFEFMNVSMPYWGSHDDRWKQVGPPRPAVPASLRRRPQPWQPGSWCQSAADGRPPSPPPIANRADRGVCVCVG